MKDYSVLAPLDTILYEDGLDGVARHVLANAEYWRTALGMDAPPEVTVHHHQTMEYRPVYDPARSTLEQRLDLASLSRAEGQE